MFYAVANGNGNAKSGLLQTREAADAWATKIMSTTPGVTEVNIFKQIAVAKRESPPIVIMEFEEQVGIVLSLKTDQTSEEKEPTVGMSFLRQG